MISEDVKFSYVFFKKNNVSNIHPQDILKK